MGFWLLFPFLLIRFGFMAVLDRSAIRRAAHFPPLVKREKGAYWVYQISTAAIFLSLFFLSIHLTPPALFYAGAGIYSTGVLLLAGSVICFAAPSESGLNERGLYRLSRNPMYVAYFIVFLGCVLLTQSLLLLLFVVSFQISAHWIIRAEERWCQERFGDAYFQYANKVGRYF